LLNFGTTAAKVLVAGAVAFGAVGVGGLSSASAQGSAVDKGAPTFTNAANTATITGGGSQTAFNLVLPGQPNADCPGDTVTGLYNVQTYLTWDNNSNGATVPNLQLDSATTSSYFVASADYANTPPPALALEEPNGAQWGGPSTSEATAPTTGQVINEPNFELASPNGTYYQDYDPNGQADAEANSFDLFPGVWDIGIACVKAGTNGAITNYWNAQIQLTTSTSDPSQFVWTVIPPATTPESPLAIGLPLSALGIAGIGAIVLRRRRRPAVAA